MHALNSLFSKRGRYVALACVAVLPMAMKMGYDFGSQIGGLWLGLAAAANVAALCALMIDAAVDRLVRP